MRAARRSSQATRCVTHLEKEAIEDPKRVMTYFDFLPGDMWMTIDGSILLLVYWSCKERTVHTTFFVMHRYPLKYVELKSLSFFSIDYNFDVMPLRDDTVSGVIIRDGIVIWRNIT